jgi:hypothetical protein
MHDLLVLAVHLLVTVAKLLRPGGARAVAAESLLLDHQLQIGGRAPQRAPNLTALSHQFLEVSVANGKPKKSRDTVADNLARKALAAVVGVKGVHPAIESEPAPT